MTFEEALKAELSVIAELEGRIYPLDAPEANAGQGVPYLVYVSSAGRREKTITDGYLADKMVPAELNIVAARYGDMKAITDKAVALIISFEQRVIGTDGPYIDEITYEQPVELYENLPNLYRCVIEFTAYFKEE